MIVLNGVSKRISSDFQLHVENITLEKGINYKISGINGSGKTVFLKLLLGIICKDAGYRKIENTISGFLGIERMLDFLTPKEYFYVVCKSYGIKKKEILARYNIINSFFNRKYMDEKKLICDYSNGNKQLIGIIAACLPYSDFVLLDEPFNYLDETTVNELVKMLDFLNQEKSISIVYSDNLKRINLSNYESLSIENGNVQALTS